MRAPTKIEHEEWEFQEHRVPSDEIELCFLHEYGRASVNFKKLVADWRAVHPNILAAARNLLSRKGPFGCTIGPIPAAWKGSSPDKPLSKADRKKADENGKAWAEWLKLSGAGGSRGGFPGADPRTFLFCFPAFPKCSWQAILPDYRRRAWLLLDPNLACSGKLHALLLLANRDFTVQMKAQQAIQMAVGAPVNNAELWASARRSIVEHILAPPLIEFGEGIKKGLVGIVPPGFSFGKTRKQFCADGFCREEVTFVINWARADGEIKKALGDWLKSPGRRPHKDFSHGSVTNAREHLRKLGALRILEAGVTAEQACDRDPITGKQFYTLYESADEYRRAKGQAIETLNNLFPADT